MLKQSTALDLFVDPVLAEHYAEAFEDADRAGYLNLGNASNWPVYFTATNDAFINGQGGDDAIVMIGTTNDTIHGGSGDDYIDGQAGNDTLFGVTNCCFAVDVDQSGNLDCCFRAQPQLR